MAVIDIMDEIFTITLIIHNWIWLVEKKIITLVFSYFIDFLLLLFASFSTVILNLLGKQSYHWWRMSLMTSYPESILCLYFLFSFIAGMSKTVYPLGTGPFFSVSTVQSPPPQNFCLGGARRPFKTQSRRCIFPGAFWPTGSHLSVLSSRSTSVMGTVGNSKFIFLPRPWAY